MAEKAGVTVLLEPMNEKYDPPNHWLTSSDKGAESVAASAPRACASSSILTTCK